MKFKNLLLSISAIALLSGCATVSNVNSDGTIEGDPVWPEAFDTNLNHEVGTFPTADELANVKAGMTKDQFYKILGRPHQNEGMFNVREWDYTFHFHTPGQGTNGVTTCQFKIVYDKYKVARSFFWHAVDPEDAVCPPAPGSNRIQRYTLASDVVFAFDKSGSGDIKLEGKAKLDELAKKLLTFDRLRHIKVIGHTDRLGTDAYNQGLSERRANTVRQYLISRGLPAGIISSEGRGEREPIKDCPTTLAKSAEIACLLDNRRVVIEVDGSGVLEGSQVVEPMSQIGKQK